MELNFLLHVNQVLPAGVKPQVLSASQEGDHPCPRGYRGHPCSPSKWNPGAGGFGKGHGEWCSFSKVAANKPAPLSIIKYAMHKRLHNTSLTTLWLLKINTAYNFFPKHYPVATGPDMVCSKSVQCHTHAKFSMLLPGSLDNHTRDFCQFILPWSWYRKTTFFLGIWLNIKLRSDGWTKDYLNSFSWFPLCYLLYSATVHAALHIIRSWSSPSWLCGLTQLLVKYFVAEAVRALALRS